MNLWFGQQNRRFHLEIRDHFESRFPRQTISFIPPLIRLGVAFR